MGEVDHHDFPPLQSVTHHPKMSPISSVVPGAQTQEPIKQELISFTSIINNYHQEFYSHRHYKSDHNNIGNTSNYNNNSNSNNHHPPENDPDVENNCHSENLLVPKLFHKDIDNYLHNFRVHQCKLFLQRKCNRHKPFTCFNWHFKSQKRRQPFINKSTGRFNYNPDIYCTVYNEQTGECPNIDKNGSCPYLHRNTGDTERRYHLRYFKTSICIHKTDSRNNIICMKNGEHCAFAHTIHTLRNPTYEYTTSFDSGLSLLSDSNFHLTTDSGPEEGSTKSISNSQISKVDPVEAAAAESNFAEKAVNVSNSNNTSNIETKIIKNFEGENIHGKITSEGLLTKNLEQHFYDEIIREKIIPDDPKWKHAIFVLIHYKTIKCEKPVRLCRQGFACPFYHNPKDKRRSPKIYKYKSTACPAVKIGVDWKDCKEPSACPNGDACNNCHTRSEQQFHPDIYKSNLCKDMNRDGYCPRNDFCAFAHTQAKPKILVKDHPNTKPSSPANSGKLVIENRHSNNLIRTTNNASPNVNENSYGPATSAPAIFNQYSPNNNNSYNNSNNPKIIANHIGRANILPKPVAIYPGMAGKIGPGPENKIRPEGKGILWGGSYFHQHYEINQRNRIKSEGAILNQNSHRPSRDHALQAWSNPPLQDFIRNSPSKEFKHSIETEHPYHEVSKLDKFRSKWMSERSPANYNIEDLLKISPIMDSPNNEIFSSVNSKKETLWGGRGQNYYSKLNRITWRITYCNFTFNFFDRISSSITTPDFLVSIRG